ncbi:MAG: glycosyltransferase [Candidatus Rokubacteria bacterium]|nr:glycosyltransferase [Candidatus Rokubacteria bacterium]
MRWLVVLPYERPGHMGVDFADELRTLGHDVRTFAYRRDNPLYKNSGTKQVYQRAILHRLERACLEWKPAIVLVIKGGPIPPAFIRSLKSRLDTLVLNVFPDNPLWMIPFPCIEAYDVFFTKERYALRCLQQAGLRNVQYLPMYCVPAWHHRVEPTTVEAERWGAPLSFVGSRYPYRERFLRELRDYPLRLWGGGWARSTDPEIRKLVGGGPVWDREKLLVYSASTLSLNQHHPMNDIVGVNTRTFELAAAGACQVVDGKEDLATLFKPGEEVVTYRDLGELKRHLDHYLLPRPDEARAIGENARRRALAEHTLRHRIEEILAVVKQRFGA